MVCERHHYQPKARKRKAVRVGCGIGYPPPPIARRIRRTVGCVELSPLSVPIVTQVNGDVSSSTSYRIVQPYGRDKARESTVISEHQTAADAFAEIDRLSSQMVRTGAPSDAVELLVVDAAGRIIQRPETH